MNKRVIKDTIKKKVAPRDTRSHEERLSCLYTAFGECKAHAKQTGKVNDCSLNKITGMAKVNKTYLTGVRKFKDESITIKYQAVNEAIQKWREEFKKAAELTKEQKEINQLTVENRNLKDSIQPILSRLNLLETLAENSPNDIKSRDEQILILQHKLRDEKVKQPIDSKVNSLSKASQINRKIVTPDLYRYVNGKYIFGDAEQNQKAIHSAYDELEKILSRDIKMRLYLLVGLPCSGKTTWAENAELTPDRHPVLFDATNLTRIDRLQFFHQVKRFDDLPICCVVIDTEITEIRKRNSKNRTSERQVPDDVLNQMEARYEKPDPYTETWINELVIVRKNDISAKP